MEESSDNTWIYDDIKWLWGLFSDIPINDDDEIEEPFMDWPVETSKYDIWNWFDDQWPYGVYDLMCGGDS